MLYGRQDECRTLARLLADARAGHSHVLLLRGEPGVGKTALLQHAIECASSWRVARAAGVESEMELAFGGLHQLCGPLLDQLGTLPDPQRDALAIAFGLSSGAAPDRFLIGLAVLSLLADVAEQQPLLCLVDDLQWLDQASRQVLAFVARRLHAEAVCMLFSARGVGTAREFSGLPELVVEGLRGADARTLLASELHEPLDEGVRDRFVAETRGNPLALLELPRGLTPAELAGGFELPRAEGLSGQIEESFLRRLAALPPDTRTLVLLAAAEPVGDPVLLWRAAERLGLARDAANAAQTAGLLEVGVWVRFRHPLVRSAVYRAAALEDRRRVHGALADATDSDIDPDRRAWHRAHATAVPDEEVARELERSADRAWARGGLAAAAAFLEQAAAHTRGATQRARRELAAAQAKQQAGALDEARCLLARAQAGRLDELGRARGDLLSAQIAFAVNRGRDAPPLLLKAARQLEPLDAGLARETYLDALWAALFVGRLATGAGVLEAARAARAAPRSSTPARAADLLLDGLALLITEGYAAGAPILKRAVRAFRSDALSTEEGIRWLWLACHAAMDLWDDASWQALSARHVELARKAGALTVLPIALSSRAGFLLFAGELPSAASLIDEVAAVTDATGSQLGPYAALARAARRGTEAEVLELVDATRRQVLDRGEGVALTSIEWASALLYNGLARYDEAQIAAERAASRLEELRFSNWALVELIEAAVRGGRIEPATDALQRLSETTQASGTDWALGVEARSRALLSTDDAAEGLYREALDRLGRTAVRTELARAHLLYGEWLRRKRRRVDAREQLRTAHEMLTAMGMEAFAERAERELRATGETARKRDTQSADTLTAQEAQIAQLARDRLSNAEIGSRLFISHRTVEYHLHKVFAKLDIRSRAELERVLPSDAETAQPAQRRPGTTATNTARRP